MRFFLLKNLHPSVYLQNYHVQVSAFCNASLVHIRKKGLDKDGNRRFLKQGVTLTKVEWDELRRLCPEVTRLLNEKGSSPTVYDLGTRGRKLTVRKYQDEMYVDIRSFWEVDPAVGPTPTKVGVVLSERAWKELLNYTLFLDDDLRSTEFSLREQAQEAAAQKARLDERRKRLMAESAPSDYVPPPPKKKGHLKRKGE